MQERSQHPVGVLPILGAELLGEIVDPDVGLLNAPIDDVSAGSRHQNLAVRAAFALPVRIVRWLRAVHVGNTPRPEAVIRADGICLKRRAAETVREREPVPT
jgi:hypothetical protein